MGTFGKKSSERPAGGGDLFLKNFKNPRTLVWFLNPDHPKDWLEYKQHFDNNAKRGWPCAIHEGANNCVGCEFPVEDETNEKDPGMRVRNTGSKWVVPVVGEKGYVELFQIGYVLWKSLKELYDEYGTLTDAWYAIRRSGESFNDITYTATKTDDRKKPEVKASVPDDEYVSNLLGKQYVEAMERYGYDPEGGDAQPDPDPVPVEKTGDVAKDALAGRKAQAAKKGAKPTEPDEAQATADTAASEGDAPSGWNERLDAKEASMGELKDWLDTRPEDKGGPIEYPPRAGRPVLVKLVESAQYNDNPGF